VEEFTRVFHPFVVWIEEVTTPVVVVRFNERSGFEAEEL